MENENERITGRVRSREQADIWSDDATQHLSRAELLQLIRKTLAEKDKTIVEKDKTIVEMDKTIVEKDKTIVEKDKTIVEKDKTIVEKDKTITEKEKLSILEDAVGNSWSYDWLMEKIDELRFEPVEYSNDFKETNPRPSSVASTKTFEHRQQQVDMSQFKYQSLSYSERCSWKQVNLPDALDSFICDTLFNKDRSVFEDTVAKFMTDLAGLRNVYCYYRQQKRKITENDHFRPTFTLWLNELVHSISVLPGWGVNVRNRTIDKLEFSVHLNIDGAAPQTVGVRGHEDVVIKNGGDDDIKIIGEYKAPFSAMLCSPAGALFHSALSQMYAEMQGFIALGRSPPTAEITSTATAAQSDGDKPWYVSFLTDGFALRLSFASEELVTGTQNLPTVYTSSNACFLEPRRFTETMLYMLAVKVTNDPHIDFTAVSDFNVDENNSLPAVDKGDDEEDGGPFYADGYDDYWQFLEDEEEEVERLNYLLESSSSRAIRLKMA